MTTQQQWFLGESAWAITGTVPQGASLSSTTPNGYGTDDLGYSAELARAMTSPSAASGPANEMGLEMGPVNGPEYVMLGRWVSDLLGAQTIAAGNWTLQGGMMAGSSGNATGKGMGAVLKVWRPSGNTLVGTIFDHATQESTTVGYVPGSNWSAVTETHAGGSVTCLDSDVLVLEVWGQYSNPSHLPQWIYFAYNGNGGAHGNDAAVLTAPNPLTLSSASGGTVSPAPFNLSLQAVVGAQIAPETNTNPVRLYLYVDWTGTGSYVDESANFRGFQVQRGRARVNDVFAAGSATILLRNIEGRYSPFNQNSAIYPYVRPGTKVSVQATYHGVAYQQFAGQITEVQQKPGPQGAAVTLRCYDALDLFRLANQIGVIGMGYGPITTDGAIAQILAAYGWAGGTYLDAGRTLNAWAPSGSVLQALQLAAAHELGGNVYMDKYGNVRFESRFTRPDAPLLFMFDSGSFNQAPGNNQIVVRGTDLISEVIVTYQPYVIAAQSPASLLYQLSGNISVPPNGGSAAISGTFPSPGALSVLGPILSGSPSTQSAWTWIGGNVTMTSFVYDAQRFKATFQNSGTSWGAVTEFVLRGQLIWAGYAPSPVDVLAVQPAVPNQPVSIDLPFSAGQNVNGPDPTEIFAYAYNKAQAMSLPHPRTVINVEGRSAGLIHSLLAADISSRVMIADTGAAAPGAIPPGANTLPLLLPGSTPAGAAPTVPSAAWLTGIAKQFFVEAISLNLTYGQIPSAQWTCFDVDQATS